MAKIVSTRPLRCLLAALVATLVLAGSTACEPPRQPAKDRVVLLVHGWSLTGGIDCDSAFGSLKSALRARGFTGAFVTVGFYTGDTNCDLNLRSLDGSVTNDTPWKNLAMVFSHYVYDRYTSRNVPVDIVGHSMGGLIARAALQGTSTGAPNFSAPLRVEDLVTIGTPHAGAAWFTQLCFWGQCEQLKEGASDIQWLATTPNPQGLTGTDTTVIGSTADDVVPDWSAISMWVPDERKAVFSDIEHDDYQRNPAAQDRIAQALTYVDR